MKKTCANCKKSYKGSKGNRCRVFSPIPENCWAWTDDPDWDRKAKEAVKRYKAMKDKGVYSGGA